jgi:hypothetical protein
MGDTLKAEIKRQQRLIKIFKKLVHELHGMPAPLGVAKLHQQSLKSARDYLKKLENLQRERKALRKPVGRARPTV